MNRFSSAPRWLLTPGLALLGAFATLAFAPFEAFWIAPLVWAGLAFALQSTVRQDKPLRHAALNGGAFGLGFFGAGVSWVYISLHTYGGMPSWLAIIAVFLFCALLASFHALFAVGFVALLRKQLHTPLTAALLFGALWGLTDCLRGWIFTGFPWLSLGYSQVAGLSPLAGYFPLLGVFGVSLLTALLAALVWAGRQGWVLIIALLLGGFGLQQIRWTAPMSEPVPVALLQGNISQSIKWEPEQFARTLNTYFRLTRDALADSQHPRLVILPETAFPAFADQLPTGYLEAIQSLARNHQADVVFGAISGQDNRYQNSAFSIGSSPTQRYDKAHLVPFGEVIPFGFQWFLDFAHIPMSSFTPGASPQTPMALADLKWAVNICYEDTFGEEIIRALPAANVLVNLSNTAWFGDSSAQPQHLQIARARALETGRPMLRATNTGMTALILPNGQIDNSLPAFTQGTLVVSVQGYEGTTPYARWGNLAFLLLTLSFLLSACRRRA